MALQSILYGTTRNALKLNDVSINCFVLENQQRVLEIKGIQKALGYDGKFENWLFEFLNDLNVYMPVPITLLLGYSNPNKIQIQEIGANQTVLNVIDSNLFVATLSLIIKAKNDNYIDFPNQKYSKAAQLILEEIGTSNIEELIDQASSFIIFKANILKKVVTILKSEQGNEVYNWITSISNPFIETLLKMNTTSWIEMNEFPEKLAAMLNEVIFLRMDESIYNELNLHQPKRAYKSKKNQLIDPLHHKLKEYVIELLTLSKAADYSWPIFIQLINKTHPKQANRAEFVYIEKEQNKKIAPSKFNQNLIKALKI